MKTDVITVTNAYDQIEKALILTEKTAIYKELSHKDTLTLRLLTEEMMSMVRSITGDIEGKFWIEDENKNFQLVLEVESDLSFDQRKQLVSASSSGKNEATKGFMGKIRAFFESDEGYPFYIEPVWETPGGLDTELTWSLALYREQIRESMKNKGDGAEEAWDELEKSVVSKLADDVKVSIRNSTVKLMIFKKIA